MIMANKSNTCKTTAVPIRNQLREKFARFFKGEPLAEEINLADKLCLALTNAGRSPHNISVFTKIFGRGQRVEYSVGYYYWNNELHDGGRPAGFDRWLCLKADINLSNLTRPFKLRIKLNELICGTLFSFSQVLINEKIYFQKDQFDKLTEELVKYSEEYR